MPTESSMNDPSARDEATDPLAEAAGGTLAALRRERDELHDKWLRGAAEFENYRRRTERERRDFAEAAAADLIRDLLPVVDDFERALASARESGTESRDPLLAGVELIYRQLLDTLRRHRAEPFDSVGQDFDPSWHEAVAQEPAHGRRDGEITAELRRGYRIGSRLLRPAQVKVAKA
jgi:molecular chaperone GrpE